MKRTCLALLACLLLAGCGATRLWPFGDSETTELSRKPAGATEYRCQQGGTFYVRQAEGGSLWLVAPDREIRLERLGEGRWGVARTELQIAADGSATLVDPPSLFSGCKRAA